MNLIIHLLIPLLNSSCLLSLHISCGVFTFFFIIFLYISLSFPLFSNKHLTIPVLLNLKLEVKQKGLRFWVLSFWLGWACWLLFVLKSNGEWRMDLEELLASNIDILSTCFDFMACELHYNPNNKTKITLFILGWVEQGLFLCWFPEAFRVWDEDSSFSSYQAMLFLVEDKGWNMLLLPGLLSWFIKGRSKMEFFFLRIL